MKAIMALRLQNSYNRSSNSILYIITIFLNYCKIMNILLLCRYNPYIENGASANRYRGLIDGLVAQGHHVALAILGGLKQKKEVEKAKSISNAPEFIYVSKSNYYSYIQCRLNIYLFDETIKPLVVRKRLRKLLQNNYDIIWLTQSDLILNLFCKVAKHIKSKTLIELNEFNDIYKGEGATSNFLQRRKGERENELFLKTVKQVDLFAVMTETLIEHYSKMAKAEAEFMLLPMTVDLSRFNKVFNEKNTYHRPYIAFTGTMNNHKDGVDVLIRSFAKVANKYPSIHLYLAGFWHKDVPMQEKLIDEFGLKERVHYLGTLNREQIPPFVCNASVLALSRPDSHQAQGGFPTKLGEYLATGNPVCVTKVGEIPKYLQDDISAFMAEPGDVDSFADALDRVLGNEENAQRVGANGRRVAEVNFDADLQAKRLSEFLMENLK